MIAPGDYLITVDGNKVSSSAKAVKAILGELSSPMTMRFERDGERFVVSLCRGKAASLNKLRARAHTQCIYSTVGIIK